MAFSSLVKFMDTTANLIILPRPWDEKYPEYWQVNGFGISAFSSADSRTAETKSDVQLAPISLELEMGAGIAEFFDAMKGAHQIEAVFEEWTLTGDEEGTSSGPQKIGEHLLVNGIINNIMLIQGADGPKVSITISFQEYKPAYHDPDGSTTKAEFSLRDLNSEAPPEGG